MFLKNDKTYKTFYLIRWWFFSKNLETLLKYKSLINLESNALNIFQKLILSKQLLIIKHKPKLYLWRDKILDQKKVLIKKKKNTTLIVFE